MTAHRSFGAASAAEEISPVAVVDIGSNSVRLAVYEGGRRSPATLYNEKDTCGLGRSLALSGRLDDDAVAQALAVLARFAILICKMGVAAVEPVATAAVREAVNGQEFLTRAEAALGMPIRVLSGAEEAGMAATGVLFGMPDARGVVGDLGGGSLELVEVAGGVVGEGETTDLGALRLSVLKGDINSASRYIDEALDDVSCLGALPGSTFYAVGGTWRTLARLHMEKTGYPLRVIEGYALEASQALALAHDVKKALPETLRAFDAVSSSRLKTLPYGALLLERLIKRARPETVIFSAHGIRDGVVLSRLPDQISDQDPLLSACLDFGAQQARSLSHIMELSAWMDPVFAPPAANETADENRLRQAACLLSDIAWQVNPDYRANKALELISIVSFAGVDHPGRAFISLAVFHRHEHRLVDPRAIEIATLVDDRGRLRARRVGASIRLANAISAEMPGILPRTRLGCDGDLLELVLPADLAAIDGHRVEKRLGHLAATVECAARVVVET